MDQEQNGEEPVISEFFLCDRDCTIAVTEMSYMDYNLMVIIEISHIHRLKIQRKRSTSLSDYRKFFI
jgi:predicted transcriptional regulator